jgi:hypothetical protein
LQILNGVIEKFQFHFVFDTPYRCNHGKAPRSLLPNKQMTPRGESWRARASQLEGSVQARAVGITAPGVDWEAADKAQTHCPRLEGLVPWVLEEPKLSRH